MAMETKVIAKIEETPAEVIATAQLAAKQLTTIISSRPNKLVVGGKQYLYFEDWQTLGKFYGVSARVLSTEELFKGKIAIGYLAKAAAVHNGYELSTAEAECTQAEPNWSSKPMFQLRSMAQTRACSKALRNCLGWVAVLAGYGEGTAEEMAPQEVANKRLLLQLIDVAKAGGYTKAEILDYAGVEKLSDLSFEEAARLIAMMKKHEPLIRELENELA